MIKLLKRIIFLALCALVLVILGPNIIDYVTQQGNIKNVEELARGVLVGQGETAQDETSGVASGESGEQASGEQVLGKQASGEQVLGKQVSGKQVASGVYDCIMVLGAAVQPDGMPSPMLKERLDTGIELYKSGVAPKLLMSGDNQSDRETYNEVNNMKAYAVAAGVPSEDIFCDHAGICTYDSAYRLYHVFGADRAVVVSQKYHLYRALFDARSFGVDAVGVACDQVDYPVKLLYYVREAAARVSDMYKVLTNADAAFLSEPVSLDQSGDVTSWEY